MFFNFSDQNFCKPNPCSHHATCVETLNGFKCICEEGYKGVRCKGNVVTHLLLLRNKYYMYVIRLSGTYIAKTNPRGGRYCFLRGIEEVAYLQKQRDKQKKTTTNKNMPLVKNRKKGKRLQNTYRCTLNLSILIYYLLPIQLIFCGFV